ncbi:hypothetical protein DE146DRAFT_434660 [Phaeosphaeria sp. MPI-PUGE-AT-0046c]|nr:hypothetical protein DE146DRAFT_434660 [Phaeosphaeria sp. MPI-PUGE-AT-0046c]
MDMACGHSLVASALLGPGSDKRGSPGDDCAESSEISTSMIDRRDQQRKLPVCTIGRSSTTIQFFLRRRVLTSRHVDPFYGNGIRIMQQASFHQRLPLLSLLQVISRRNASGAPRSATTSKITSKLQDRTRQCRSTLTWLATHVCCWMALGPILACYALLPSFDEV